MTVTVETGKWAVYYTKDRAATIELPEKSSVLDAIKALNIPPDEAGIAVKDGKAMSKEKVLSDGDKIKIHPVIIGG